MLSASGTDTTQAILQQQGYTLILFSRHLDNVPAALGNSIKEVERSAAASGIPMVWVSSDAAQATGLASDWALQGIPLLRGDLVAIKTAARVNPTLYLLNKGTVVKKWPYTRFSAVPAVLKQSAAR
jgi:hypothetical protein